MIFLEVSINYIKERTGVTQGSYFYMRFKDRLEFYLPASGQGYMLRYIWKKKNKQESAQIEIILNKAIEIFGISQAGNPSQFGVMANLVDRIRELTDALGKKEDE